MFGPGRARIATNAKKKSERNGEISKRGSEVRQKGAMVLLSVIKEGDSS